MMHTEVVEPFAEYRELGTPSLRAWKRTPGDEIMSEERDAEIARLKETLDELRKRLERSTSTLFEPGDELVWFDEGEVNTMGAHTHIAVRETISFTRPTVVAATSFLRSSVTTRRHRPPSLSAAISRIGKPQHL